MHIVFCILHNVKDLSTSLNCTLQYYYGILSKFFELLFTGLYYTALHCAALLCSTLNCTALLHTTLLHTALHSSDSHCSAPHCTDLLCLTLHCCTLHCTALLHTTLLHIALLFSAPHCSARDDSAEWHIVIQLLGWSLLNITFSIFPPQVVAKFKYALNYTADLHCCVQHYIILNYTLPHSDTRLLQKSEG